MKRGFCERQTKQYLMNALPSASIPAEGDWIKNQDDVRQIPQVIEPLLTLNPSQTHSRQLQIDHRNTMPHEPISKRLLPWNHMRMLSTLTPQKERFLKTRVSSWNICAPKRFLHMPVAAADAKVLGACTPKVELSVLGSEPFWRVQNCVASVNEIRLGPQTLWSVSYPANYRKQTADAKISKGHVVVSEEKLKVPAVHGWSQKGGRRTRSVPDFCFCPVSDVAETCFKMMSGQRLTLWSLSFLNVSVNRWLVPPS